MKRPLVAALAALALVGLASRAPAGAPGPLQALRLVTFDSGIKAPRFTLSDLEGRPVSVSAPEGAATLLVFWATW